MATYFAERPVTELLYYVIATFGATASALQSERNDGIAVWTPDVWRDHATAPFAANRAQLEVFFTGGEFPHLRGRELLGITNDDGPQTITTETRGVIRVRHCNRDGVTLEQMSKRTQRYLTVLMRCMRADPSLDGTVVFCVPTDFTVSSAEVEGADAYNVLDTLILNWYCLTSESNDSEGVSGAATVRDLSSYVRTRS